MNCTIENKDNTTFVTRYVHIKNVYKPYIDRWAKAIFTIKPDYIYATILTKYNGIGARIGATQWHNDGKLSRVVILYKDDDNDECKTASQNTLSSTFIDKDSVVSTTGVFYQNNPPPTSPPPSVNKVKKNYSAGKVEIKNPKRVFNSIPKIICK